MQSFYRMPSSSVKSDRLLEAAFAIAFEALIGALPARRRK
jgi:hypothetical protein